MKGVFPVKQKGGIPMDDTAIVELFWQRDEGAIAVTQEKYHPYLMKIARNILDDSLDSEESVNDTYFAAWNSIPPHKPSVLSLYLAKLTRRIAISKYRKKTVGKRKGSEFSLALEEVENLIADPATPEGELEAKELGKALNRFLRTLSQEEQNTFIGRYFYLDPLKKVADYCGMSEGKAKSMLFRTRQKLREYLLKEGFEV